MASGLLLLAVPTEEWREGGKARAEVRFTWPEAENEKMSIDGHFKRFARECAIWSEATSGEDE